MTEEFIKPNLTSNKNLEQKAIKEGVDFVFKHNPELASIGSKEQYSKYLEKIFPNSVTHSILYRGDNTKFSLPVDNNVGVYLTANKNTAFQYGDRATTAIIETKNPYYTNNYPSMYWNRIIDKLDRLSKHDSVIFNNGAEIVVAPNQIHILGSQVDIENFKQFILNKEK